MNPNTSIDNLSNCIQVLCSWLSFLQKENSIYLSEECVYMCMCMCVSVCMREGINKENTFQHLASNIRWELCCHSQLDFNIYILALHAQWLVCVDLVSITVYLATCRESPTQIPLWLFAKSSEVRSSILIRAPLLQTKQTEAYTYIPISCIYFPYFLPSHPNPQEFPRFWRN